MNKQTLKSCWICKKVFMPLMLASLIFGTNFSTLTAYAASTTSANLSGEVYEFDGKNSKYTFSDSSPSGAPGYGTLSISGEISEKTTKDGVPAFTVSSGNLDIAYCYTDDLLNAEPDQWHLIDDSGKKVDSISLGKKINKGAIILQTSKDGKVWVDAYSDTNIFKNFPNQNEAFTSTTDVQLSNGCFYRVIVAYEVRRETSSTKIVIVDKKNYEYKKYAEVYVFYASRGNESAAIDENTKSYNLGEKIRTAKYEGFVGEKTITNNDPHYGWNVGQFAATGFTDYIKEENGNVVFLKNVGDQLALSFYLNWEIDSLNNKDELTIMDDESASDQYFETPTTNFGHGTLIIRKTDSSNVKGDSQIYTNYLEATASVGANTKVDLFEEGDYEVALDYGVRYDKTKLLGQSILPEEAHYRIFFTFSVRNSNSMFFPRDVQTQSELSDKSFTSNGFYLDLANSQYLNLFVVKEILKEGATGLSEDVRYNRAAKDGDSFTDEGIYTVTVTNQYTGQSTTKTLYVGDNDILKAYVTTGLSISEIQKKVDDGATIQEDGSIIELSATEEMVITSSQEETSENSGMQGKNEGNADVGEKFENKVPYAVVGGITVIALFIIFMITSINKKREDEKR